MLVHPLKDSVWGRDNTAVLVHYAGMQDSPSLFAI